MSTPIYVKRDRIKPTDGVTRYYCFDWDKGNTPLLGEALEIEAAIAPIDFDRYVWPYLWFPTPHKNVTWSDAFDEYELSFSPFEQPITKEHNSMGIKIDVVRTSRAGKTENYSLSLRSQESNMNVIRNWFLDTCYVANRDFDKHLQRRIVERDYCVVEYSDRIDSYVITISALRNEVCNLIVHNTDTDQWHKNTQPVDERTTIAFQSWLRCDVQATSDIRDSIIELVEDGKPFMQSYANRAFDGTTNKLDVYCYFVEKEDEPTKQEMVEQASKRIIDYLATIGIVCKDDTIAITALMYNSKFRVIAPTIADDLITIMLGSTHKEYTKIDMIKAYRLVNGDDTETGYCNMGLKESKEYVEERMAYWGRMYQ